MYKLIPMTVLIAVCVVLGTTAEANASSVKTVKTLAPRVKQFVSAIPPTVGKIGDRVSNWAWKNKGVVATGAVLTTFVVEPKPFVEGATSVACTTAEKTIEAVVTPVTAKVVEAVVPKAREKTTPSSDGGFSGFGLIVGCVVLLGLFILYERGGWSRLLAKLGIVALIIVAVSFFCVPAKADDFQNIVTPVEPLYASMPSMDIFWKILNILLVLLMFLPLSA